MLSRAAATPILVSERERRGREEERRRRADILGERVVLEFDMIGRRGNSIIDVLEFVDRLVGE